MKSMRMNRSSKGRGFAGLTAAAGLMAILAVTVCQPGTQTPPAIAAGESSGGVIEIAVSQVDAGRLAEFKKTRAAARQAVRKFPGFRSWHSYRSVHAADIYMDRLVWDSAEEAGQAAKTMERSELGRRYFSFIKEIKLFDHFTPDGESTIGISK